MAELTLFQHDNYNGQHRDVTHTETSFNSIGFNDTVSSIKVKSGTWQIFQHVNFGGISVTLSKLGGPAGNGLYPNPGTMGGQNDTWSSVKLLHP